MLVSVLEWPDSLGGEAEALVMPAAWSCLLGWTGKSRGLDFRGVYLVTHRCLLDGLLDYSFPGTTPTWLQSLMLVLPGRVI